MKGRDLPLDYVAPRRLPADSREALSILRRQRSGESLSRFDPFACHLRVNLAGALDVIGDDVLMPLRSHRLSQAPGRVYAVLKLPKPRSIWPGSFEESETRWLRVQAGRAQAKAKFLRAAGFNRPPEERAELRARVAAVTSYRAYLMACIHRAHVERRKGTPTS